MRLKYYLRGLGIGIIFAVFIMMVGYRNHGSSMSDSEIIEKAKALGMVETEDSSGMKSDKKTDNKTDEKSDKKIDTSEPDTTIADTSAAEDTQTGTDNTDADNIAGTADVDTTAPSDVAATDSAASDAAQPQQNTTFTVTVGSGDTCRMIAERLQAAGIIDDAEKFRAYMGQKGVDQFIADGNHEIPYGASYDDIINILTQK